jgi:hypothetical protein
MSPSEYISLGQYYEQMYAYYQSQGATQSDLSELYDIIVSLAQDSTYCFGPEESITEAVAYVLADHIPTMYFATGHGEKNTQGGPLDITGLSKIPEEAAMLVINTPDEDYSDAETDMLIDFMDKGGRLIVFTGKQNNSMPNLARLLASAGLSLEPDAIDEETVTTTVNTSSDALSLLASTEKVTLDIMNGDSILTDESDTSLKFTSLYTLDVEVETETNTKVVTKNLGVAVTKNSEPMLVWITGSDTSTAHSPSLAMMR